MNLKEIISVLEKTAPPVLQESYDNSGLLIGDADEPVRKALITLDVTDHVIDEAVSSGCDLIIAHHPLIFKGLKKLTGSSQTERLVVRLIRENIAVYAMHTNLDNVDSGVNYKLATVLGLGHLQILSAGAGSLKKLVTFCPVDHSEKVREAMFLAGAGHIGDYDSCSYNLTGVGTFRGLEGTDPFVGQKGELHVEPETRIETIVPDYRLDAVVSSMMQAHPYEEVAYDIYPLDNTDPKTGAGMMGELESPVSALEFLKQVKKTLSSKALKYSGPLDGKIKKVAVCGGSGAFLIGTAFRSGADIFVTGDVKYHDYFEFAGKMIVADAGHYETEQFTKALIHDILKKKFPTFALQISEVNTNPVKVL
jgi:dinuclear metal center YbgI/SA1388 family protein